MTSLPNIRKVQVLACLESRSEQDARQIAGQCVMTVEAAGMLVLRLFRRGLVHRAIDADDGVYFYSLSQKGLDRLGYLKNREA